MTVKELITRLMLCDPDAIAHARDIDGSFSPVDDVEYLPNGDVFIETY